jgi:N-acetylneuraminate synthase
MAEINIGSRRISEDQPTYFIADVAANHDGQLERAMKLIQLAAAAGADAVKFQHFRAPKIASRRGFESLGGQLSHQAKWKKSVYQVYESASVDWDWTETLRNVCEEAKIHFFSAPYDLEAVDMLDSYVPAYKIGSGDITWIEELEYIAQKGKPILLATGASDLGEVQRAVAAILAINPQLLLMQCNTNYTGSRENFRYQNLKVLNTFRSMYPDLVFGLSDHTPGHAAVLGAVALGARAIEKHFTDDSTREGPDHSFALDPLAWRAMVDRTRELEYAMGDGNKVVEPNEKETVIVQRRCVRASETLKARTSLSRADIEPLRPAPPDSISPHEIPYVIGRTLRRDMERGDYLKWSDLD